MSIDFQIVGVFHEDGSPYSHEPYDGYVRPQEVINLACRGFVPGDAPDVASVRFERHKAQIYQLETMSVSAPNPDGIVMLVAKMPNYRLPDMATLTIGTSFYGAPPWDSVVYYRSHLYDRYVARATIPFGGGVFGISEDHVIFDGATLDWPKTLVACVVTVEGGGHAEILDKPSAGFWWLFPNPSANLRLKYHIGLPAAQGTNVIISYTAAVPHGTSPPFAIDGLSDWTFVGSSAELIVDGTGVYH